ncbi:hypothetical protein YC2023_010446 [Brassica napus]
MKQVKANSGVENGFKEMRRRFVKTRSGSESELEGAEQDDSWWTGGGSKSRLSVKKKTRRVNRIHGFTGVLQYIQGHSAFDQVAFQPALNRIIDQRKVERRVTQRFQKTFDSPTPKPNDMTHQQILGGFVARIHRPHSRSTMSIQTNDSTNKQGERNVIQSRSLPMMVLGEALVMAFELRRLFLWYLRLRSAPSEAHRPIKRSLDH